MTKPADPPAAAATAKLRLRQRQIGRELRLYYERDMREPLPADMLDALLEADSRRRTSAPDREPPASRR